MFAVIIGITLCVVVWAAKKTKTAADFYAAGDYMSAALFLGISGLISLYGYDGFMYSVGWLVAYITVLLIVAEPCRNAGKFTSQAFRRYVRRSLCPPEYRSWYGKSYRSLGFDFLFYML